MIKPTTTINNDLKSAFFENAYSPFVILDDQMNFVDVNQASIATLGIPKENFIGRNLLDIFPYLKGTERYDAYKEVLKTGVPAGYDELSFVRDNVEYKWMVKAFKIGDYLGISTRDITNLSNTIDQLKIAQHSLKDVNVNLKRKNRELEEFSYVAAHDLRAPLTNLKSLFEMFLKAGPISDELSPIVVRMQSVTKIMCDKIRALNEVIAVKSNFNGNHEKVVFSEVVAKVKAGLSEDIIKSRAIIKEDFSGCPSLKYSPIHIESIVQNLMSNALKYRHPKRKPIIKISAKEVHGKIHLSFKDNGLGFDPALSDKIFGLFKRMHTHVEGLGIGLYIIHSIVTQSGGGIEVESQVNKGTEFKIQF
ncbi:PAS domain-containing sensor histidine kinase [Zobellia galactanivorans]|uniref:sensor histidine kinase n=1 Tax=Zobellia galactanivorans (strain DSM 12802 / CCUG 47099 / CIP 106680 / NCIMB 13871 / Dsij) TaxID=63186 RepID=UPI0026E23304|nr:PAS domain-containing sensor histidine kinase [Zobellia galactanivorans]MDO6810590.1 PAS domain-containing sensor histidine kinase [Zobellia galactanivorans]